MSNLKKYNIFITITSFARNLIEVFIPLLLYDKGFSIKNIILFLIFKYFFCVLFIPVGKKIGEKFSFTTLMFVSTIIFSATYIYLNYINTNILSLIILSLLLAMYLVFYYLGRHIYALAIIEDKKTTDNVSLYQIFTLLGSLFSTYIGAIIIEKFNYLTLAFIVLILMIISIIPLVKIKNVNINKKVKMKRIIKTYPIRNYAFTIIEQLRYLGINFLPLYIYLNIFKKFNYLGKVSMFCSLGSIIFIYFLSKKMDKDKRDYLKLSSLLFAIVLIFKLIIKSKTLFLFIAFIEGIFKVCLDTITTRNTYVYSKNYDQVNYVSFIEFINNTSRVIFLLIFYLFDLSLVTIIIIGIIGVIINSFIGYDDGKYGYKKIET